MSDGGKGSKRRPTNEQQYQDNWERIFNKDKDDTPTEPEGTTSNPPHIQSTKKRRRIISRVVGRNRR